MLQQLVGLLVVLAVARWMPRPAWRLLSPAWCLLKWVGRRHRLSLLLVGTVSLLLGLAVATVHPPTPSVHDEFSYLLAADTFSQGRLTNPTHPMWEHFETIHVIHNPSYMSKYPPANGLLLAFGVLMTGRAFFGVCLGTALAATAVCWMLQSVMPGRWALLGALLLVFHVKMQLYWGQTYWGGGLPMLGGALLCGAYFRMLRRIRLIDALAMSGGLAILANTRPFEGFILGLFVLGSMLVWLFGRRRPPWPQFLVWTAVPIAIVLIATGGLMMHYNRQVTGSALQMPYHVHEQTYSPTPLFLWQDLSAPAPSQHASIRNFFASTQTIYNSLKQPGHFVGHRLQVALAFWLFFVGIHLSIAVLPLRRLLRDRAARFAVLGILWAFGLSCAGVWIQPHYLAAALPLLWLVVVQGLRHVRTWNTPDGRALVAGLFVLQVAIFTTDAVRHIQSAGRWERERERVAQELSVSPGNDLVVVRYRAQHNPLHEWIYNAADIDRSPIVWAREMSPDRNRELLDYFSDRHIWLLDVDTQPPVLIRHRDGSEGT